MPSDGQAVGVLNYFRAQAKGIHVVVIGSPARCRDKILQLCEAFDCNEFIAMPMFPDQAQTVRGMTALAKELLQ